VYVKIIPSQRWDVSFETQCIYTRLVVFVFFPLHGHTSNFYACKDRFRGTGCRCRSPSLAYHYHLNVSVSLLGLLHFKVYFFLKGHFLGPVGTPPPYQHILDSFLYACLWCVRCYIYCSWEWTRQGITHLCLAGPQVPHKQPTFQGPWGTHGPPIGWPVQKKSAYYCEHPWFICPLKLTLQ